MAALENVKTFFRSSPAMLVLAGAGYFLLAILSLFLAKTFTYVAPIWFANIIFLAIILRSPWQNSWNLMIVAFLATLVARLVMGSSQFAAIGFAFTNLAELLLPFILLRPLHSEPIKAIANIKELLRILLIVIIFGSTVSAMLGALILSYVFPYNYFELFWRWWVVDAAICISLLPVGLSISLTRLKFLAKRQQLIETIFLILISLTLTYFSLRFLPFPFIVILFPLLIIAFRLGFFVTSLTCFANLLAVIIFQFSEPNLGSLALLVPKSMSQIVHLFITLSMLPPLIISLLIEQRNRTEADLSVLTQRLMMEIHTGQLLSTEKNRMQEVLNYQITHDKLTGLINRDEFEIRLKMLLNTASQETDVHTLAYLDVDRLKMINDAEGHVAGDSLLRSVALTLQKYIRTGDVLSRMGGDEFGLIFPFTAIDDANKIVETMLKQVSDLRFKFNGKDYEVSLSIGLYEFSPHDTSIKTLISKADAACYTAKRQGRGRISIYTEYGQASKYRTEIQIIAGIKHALRDNKILLYAQEIRPLKKTSHHFPHYEILVRLQDEKGEIILPDAFIPAAERYDLAAKIDEWVINRIFLHYGPLIALQKRFPLSINLSANSINDPNFLNYIRDVLKQTPIPRGWITFEITESMLVEPISRLHEFVQSLQELGCAIALDDFGNGFCSFNYLKQCHAEMVKIDSSFVKGILTNSVDRAIIESIQEVSHRLGARTVAEGVEDADVLFMVTEIGIDYAQGFHVKKPAPIEEVLTELKTEGPD